MEELYACRYAKKQEIAEKIIITCSAKECEFGYMNKIDWELEEVMKICKVNGLIPKDYIEKSQLVKKTL